VGRDSLCEVNLRVIGETGVRVSAVGLGCNRFGEACDLRQCRAIVDAALEHGVNHFDTAAVYNGGDSERHLGEALKGRRDRAVVATKFAGTPAGPVDGVPRGRAKNVRSSIEGSLRRLQTDYVDLFYYHRPDGVTPIEETLGAMQTIVEEGKARAIGCSNVTPAQLRQADDAAPTSGRARFGVVQNQYSLLERDDDRELLPLCRSLGVGYIPYFPLASGALTGKFERGRPVDAGTRLGERAEALLTDRAWAWLAELAAFANERGHTLHELAIAALVSTPGIVSVIAGARSFEQLHANAGAAAWTLSEVDLAAIPRIEGGGLRVLS
jgi:aryl-alcohol dehydrogenase-like predicted oxidoreductase